MYTSPDVLVAKYFMGILCFLPCFRTIIVSSNFVAEGGVVGANLDFASEGKCVTLLPNIPLCHFPKLFNTSATFDGFVHT